MHFCILILIRETFTFLSLIVFSILDDTNLLTTFPFGNNDGTASGLSIYFKLPPRRRHFSSWLSSNESSVKWSEHTWTALSKTGLTIAVIQASPTSFLSWPGILWYETLLFNLDWFEQPFTHQVPSFVSSKIPFHQKFPLISYNLNTVSLNDKYVKSSRRISS